MIQSNFDSRAGMSYNEALKTLEDLTSNFTELEGAVRVSYEYERKMVEKILKKHYQQVESVSGADNMKYSRSSFYIVSYSRPVKAAGMWKYDAAGEEKDIEGSTDSSRDNVDDVRWDLLDYLKDKLESEVESNLMALVHSDVPSYRKLADEVGFEGNLSDSDYNKLESARRRYIDVLIDHLTK